MTSAVAATPSRRGPSPAQTPARTPAMRKYQSSPDMRPPPGTMSMSIKVPHRGANDIGTVMGHHVGEDQYVPRAMWTQSHDNPINTPYEAKQQLANEFKRMHMETRSKEYIKHQLGKQLDENKALRQTMKDENKEYGKTLTADMKTMIASQSAGKDQEHRNKQTFKAGLDEQSADLARRSRDNRLQEARDAAEMKLRTVKQLCDEFAEESKKSGMLKGEMETALRDVENKKRQQRNDKERENEEFRRSVQKTLLLDEHKLLAQSSRLEAAQSSMEGSWRAYEKTAGRANKMREQNADFREDRDEKLHQNRMDMHYTRREVARERQRHRMIEGLNAQCGLEAKRKELDKLHGEAERAAINASVRKTLTMEHDKMKAKRAEEVAIQQELVQAIRAKQEKQAASGEPKQNASMRTMTLPINRSEQEAADISRRLDAPRLLVKPLGQPCQMNPDIDITRSAGIGGVTGVFAGEGGYVKAALACSGGTNRLPRGGFMEKTAALMSQDHRLATGWTEGLSPAQLKTATQNALKRQKNTALGAHDAS